MTIEISLLITFISCGTAVYFGAMALRRNQKVDDDKDSSAMTTVIVKLENITNGVSEIKSELSSVKNEMREDHDRIIKVEASLDSCWKRIDEIRNILGIGREHVAKREEE